MLDIFRNKVVRKTIFWALAVMIVPGFIIWESRNSWKPKEKGPAFVGFIENRKVTPKELNDSIDGIKAQIILNYYYDSSIPENVFKDKLNLAMLGWKRLVLLNEAGKYGIRTPDKDIIEYIRSHPLFMTGGKFDQDLYSKRLRYYFGLSPRKFEEATRGTIEISKLKDMIAKDVKVSDEEVLREYRRENEKIKILYAVVPDSDFKDRVNVEEKMTRSYYEQNKLEFMVPSGAFSASVIADYGDVKDAIRGRIGAWQARAYCREHVLEAYKKIKDDVEKNGKTFRDAAEAAGLALTESPQLSRSDTLEGIGNTGFLIDMVMSMKDRSLLPPPVELENSIMVFNVSEFGGIDEKKFGDEKKAYSEKLLEDKKMKKLDDLFNEVSPRSHLDIDPRSTPTR